MTTATAPKTIDHAAAAAAYQALHEALAARAAQEIDVSRRPWFDAADCGPPCQPAVWRANFGRQRAFQCRADARAYDAGWGMYPDKCYAPAGTPASKGWFDREAAATGDAAAADDVLAWAYSNAKDCGVHP